MTTRGKSSILVACAVAAVGTLTGPGSGGAGIAPNDTAEIWDRDTDDGMGNPDVLGQKENGDSFGKATAMGDFNNDGFADVAIGVPGDDVVSSNNGAVNVLYGTAAGLTTKGQRFIDLSDNEFPQSPTADDMFGFALAAGDFDGNGYDDLAIGAPGRDDGAATASGAIFIIDGGPDGLSSDNGTQHFPQDVFPFYGAETYDQFGLVLASGNFDGQFHDDLAIGTPFEDISGVGDHSGAVTVMYSGENGLNTSGAHLLLDPDEDEYSSFGRSLAAADVDGDGIDELAVGAPDTNAGLGSAFVYRASPSGIGHHDSPWVRFDAAEPGTRFGFALAFGDFDLDGIPDLAIGEPQVDVDGEARAGAVHIVPFGPKLTPKPGRHFDLGQDDVEGVPTAEQQLGFGLAVGEFDGDGVPDLVVSGEPGEDGIVLSGRRDLGLSGLRLNELRDGGGAPSAGDITGDGIDDLIVGHGGLGFSGGGPYYPHRLDGFGSALVRHGTRTGPVIHGPERFLDTREGNQTIDGEFAGVGRVKGGEFIRVQIAGRGNVADDAVAAIANLTIVDAAGPGYATLFTCSDSVPTASTLNYEQGQTLANGAVAALNMDGELCIFTLADADIVLDVVGYAPSLWSEFVGGRGLRVLETRPGLTTYDDEFAGIGRRPAGSVTELELFGRPMTAPTVDTIMLNVTAVDPAADGYLAVYPCTDAVPNSSSVNYQAGQTVANGVAVKLSDDYSVCIYTLAETDILADVTGYATPFTGVVPVEPVRALETRSNLPTDDGLFAGIGAADARSVTRIEIAGRGSIPDDARIALVNMTVVAPGAPGFATIYPCTDEVPTASNVNYVDRFATPNSAVVRLSDDGDVCIYTHSKAHLLLDVLAYGY